MVSTIYFILFIHWHLFKAKLISWFKRKKSVPKEKTILYLCAFFPGNAGYEWRVSKWAELLTKEGYEVDIAYCVDRSDYENYPQNPIRFLTKFLRKRFKQVLKANQYETVIVRRELLPYNEYGNHFLEKLLRKQCSNLVLDFDDDLAASKNQPKASDSLFSKILLEDGNSFRNSFQYYDKFSVASAYLKSYLMKYGGVNPSCIEVIPTCVDYSRYTPKNYISKTVFRLGWIGGTYNFYLIESIVPQLNALFAKIPFEFVVISKNCLFKNANFPVEYREWSLESEVSDLATIDIGLMPLFETDEDKGKGGFKLIQYMGMGIVSVASAVTINTEIVEDGVNSFLVHNEHDWLPVLESVLKQEYDLKKIGALARERIEMGYSFNANKEVYLKLI